MKKNILKWIRRYYNGIINSIAFYPALIALCFLVLSYLMLMFDFSETGKQLKSKLLDFISLKDASTARTITATVAGGILSLTVFSFSMVMILLNQAASNMSNRVLDIMIGNRFQQWVLGFYIGTIVYALFLLSSIRDLDSGVYVPAISVYLLILLTITDIFLFIYFLHYITQSVKYEVIIKRIYTQTMQELRQCYPHTTKSSKVTGLSPTVHEFRAKESGYFQGIEKRGLLALCAEQNWVIRFYYSIGSFILRDVPMLAIHTPRPVTKEQEERLDTLLNFYRGEPINVNPYYGFNQLTEVAIKALSPGINDPGTAVLSLHALTDLLTYRMNHFPPKAIPDEDGTERIILQEEPFNEIFTRAILPIWDYGKEDRILKNALEQMLQQMKSLAKTPENKEMVDAFYGQTLRARNGPETDQ